MRLRITLCVVAALAVAVVALSLSGKTTVKQQLREVDASHSTGSVRTSRTPGTNSRLPGLARHDEPRRNWRVKVDWRDANSGTIVEFHKVLRSAFSLVAKDRWGGSIAVPHTIFGPQPESRPEPSDEAFLEFEVAVPRTALDFEAWTKKSTLQSFAPGCPFPETVFFGVPVSHRPKLPTASDLIHIAEACAGLRSSIELNCEADVNLLGTVRNESAQPIAGAEIQLIPIMQVYSEPAGDWLSDGWPARHWNVEGAWCPWWNGGARAASWAGSVVGDNARLVQPGATTALKSTPEYERSTYVPALQVTSGSEGEFTLSGVPAGDYWIAVAKVGRVPVTQHLELKTDGRFDATLNSSALASLTLRVHWPTAAPDFEVKEVEFNLAAGVPGYGTRVPVEYQLALKPEYASTTEYRIENLNAGWWHLNSEGAAFGSDEQVLVSENGNTTVDIDLRKESWVFWKLHLTVGVVTVHDFAVCYRKLPSPKWDEVQLLLEAEDESKPVHVLTAGTYEAKIAEFVWQFSVSPGETRVDNIHIPVRDVTVLLDTDIEQYVAPNGEVVELTAVPELASDPVYDRIMIAQRGENGRSRGVPLAAFSNGTISGLKLPSGHYEFTLRGRSWLKLNVDLTGEGPMTVNVDAEHFPELAPFDVEIRGGDTGEIWSISSRATGWSTLRPLEIDDDGRTDKPDAHLLPGFDYKPDTPLKKRCYNLPTEFSVGCIGRVGTVDTVMWFAASSPGSLVIDVDTIKRMPKLRFASGKGQDSYLLVYAENDAGTGAFGTTVGLSDPEQTAPFMFVPLGRIRIRVYKALGRESGNRMVELVVNVGANGHTLDIDTLDFENDRRGTLEVTLSGMPRIPKLRDRMWGKRGDTEWATRAGDVFIGHCIEIVELVNGLEESRCPRIYAGNCRSNGPPRLSKVYTLKLPPGRYRVLPWRNATLADCREIEIKSGETTKVEVRTD